VWSSHTGWFALQGASDARRPVLPAWGPQHTGPRTPEGLQRIVKARTVHGAYGAEMRELRRLVRALKEGRRRALEMVK
jgi:hypothetical protein